MKTIKKKQSYTKPQISLHLVDSDNGVSKKIVTENETKSIAQVK